MPATLDAHDYIATVTGRANDSWDKATEQYNWAKDRDVENRKTGAEVTRRAMQTGADFTGDARRDRALYDEQMPDAMREQMTFARNYTTPSRMAANRGSAIAGASMASAAATKGARDQLQSFGVDPSAGRFAGLEEGMAARAGAMKAAAGTKSDRDTEMLGQQYLQNAMNTQSVLPGQANAEAGVGLAAQNQAVNTGLATTASGSSTMGKATEWTGLGNDMIKEWQKAQKDAAEVQLANDKLAQGSSSGTGAMIGTGLGILGTVVGSMYGGPMGGMAGGAAGNAAGKAIASRHGGTVPRFRAGGPVSRVGSTFRGPGLPKEPDENIWRKPYDTDDPVSPDDRHGEWEHPGLQGSPRHPGLPYDEEDDGDYPTPGPSPEAPDTEPEAPDELPRARYAEGGVVGDDGLSPEERQAYDAHWAQYGGDDNDMSAHWNTKLLPDEEDQYRTWAEKNGRTKDVYDYDLRGAWHEGLSPDGNDHLPDTYKKPNHPTFSQESQYHGSEGHRGGRWDADETGSETLQPYDPRFDPRREELDDADYRRMIGRQTMHLPPDSPVDQIAHPSYEQLHGDRDLRRGLTRQTQQYAEGGGVEEGEFEELTPEVSDGGQQGNMVPTEASPSGGADEDDVHAMVSADEFVMPKDVAKWYGEKYLQGLIEKARREMEGATAKPEQAAIPQAIALSPPAFRSEGARG